MFWWNSSGEIQANKKLVSKSIVLLQPFDTQLVFFGPDLLMKCCSWLIYTKCKLTLWHLCFFSVPFPGLTTITFIGKAEFSCVTCSMLVCYVLQRISIIQTCRMLCVRLYAITWLVSTSDFFFCWLFIFLERVTALCVQHDWCKGCCLLHLLLAV